MEPMTYYQPPQSNVVEPYTPHLHKSRSRMDESWKTTQEWKGKREQETWKMSAKPRHAQLIQDTSAIRRQSAPVYRKPLPQEPLVYPTTGYQGSGYFQPVMVPETQAYYGYHPYPAEYPTTVEYPTLPAQPTCPALETPVTLSDPPLEKQAPVKTEKMIKQITVQSINKEHRVWIDVVPSETGISLAEKIHIIATFRTRKIVSITTASGRKIPLDHRPVFGNWVDMDSFENGERWKVEWCENDRGVMERWISKVVQAGGGKRTKDHIAKA